MIHEFTIYVLQCTHCARQLMYDCDGLVFYSKRHLIREAMRQGWSVGNVDHFCGQCRKRPNAERKENDDA